MGFRYLDRLASPEQIHGFLELMDLAAGGGDSAQNVFELSHRLRKSSPMQLCRKRLARDPEAQRLIQARQLSGPYDTAALKALPKGSLGHTYATVLGALGYDINFFPEPSFFGNLETDADYINYRVYATHDLHHILTGCESASEASHTKGSQGGLIRRISTQRSTFLSLEEGPYGHQKKPLNGQARGPSKGPKAIDKLPISRICDRCRQTGRPGGLENLPSHHPNKRSPRMEKAPCTAG